MPRVARPSPERHAENSTPAKVGLCEGSPVMTGEIPTRVGDVLILTAAGGGTIHLVCPVSADGDQSGTTSRHDVSGRPEAEATARRLVVPGGRIFLKDQESGEWEHILN